MFGGLRGRRNAFAVEFGWRHGKSPLPKGETSANGSYGGCGAASPICGFRPLKVAVTWPGDVLRCALGALRAADAPPTQCLRLSWYWALFASASRGSPEVGWDGETKEGSRKVKCSLSSESHSPARKREQRWWTTSAKFPGEVRGPSTRPSYMRSSFQ